MVDTTSPETSEASASSPTVHDFGLRPQVDYYALDELLRPDERELRARVRAFVDAEITPAITPYVERGEFPAALASKLKDLNIVGGSIRGYGCPGLSYLATTIVASELARGDGSISTFYGVHSGLAMGAIGFYGSPEQRERWLPPMARMETLGAFALTEPDHGSDSIALETRARRDGDAYVLDGRKRWIGNGTNADVIVTCARDEAGDVGCYLVERGTSGMTAEPIDGKIGKRAIVQADMRFDGARVPAGNKLPGVRSFRDLGRLLGATRGGVAAEAVGHATAAYECALAYAKERTQFGKPIASFQLVQSKLAHMLADLTTMQLVLFRLSQLAEAGTLTAGQASLAKMNNAASARRICADARDLLGGNGVLLAYQVARHMLDAEIVYTYEGTDAMQALIVGKDITGIAAFA